MTPIVRRGSLMFVAITAGAFLLIGVFAQSWWWNRWGDGWLDATTGSTRGCVPGRCFDDSLDALEERSDEWDRRRKGAADEFDRTGVERISRSRALRLVAPLTAGLLLLAAAVGRRRGRLFALGQILGVALLLSAAAAALLALGVFKATELLGDQPGLHRGAGFPLTFVGATLAAAVGAWVAAPPSAAFRSAAPFVAAMAAAGGLLLATATVSTWCWSTQTSTRGEVRPIRSTTLLRANDCFGGERCHRVWLGEGRWSKDPPEAIWAGRITFATSIATIAASAILVVGVLGNRSRRSTSGAVRVPAVTVVLVGAVVILASSAWFVHEVPRLTPVVSFLGWGPVFAVSGALLCGTAAMWTRGALSTTALPQAVALPTEAT